MAVYALLGRSHLDDFIHVEDLLLLDVAINGYLPGACFEILGEAGGLVLIGRKFVVIVVVGDIFKWGNFLGGGEWTFLESWYGGQSRAAVSPHYRGRYQVADAKAGDGRRTGNCYACEEFSAVQIDSLGRDFGPFDVGSFFYKHKTTLFKVRL